MCATDENFIKSLKQTNKDHSKLKQLKKDTLKKLLPYMTSLTQLLVDDKYDLTSSPDPDSQLLFGFKKNDEYYNLSVEESNDEYMHFKFCVTTKDTLSNRDSDISYTIDLTSEASLDLVLQDMLKQFYKFCYKIC